MRIGNRYITLRKGSIAWRVRNFLVEFLFLAFWLATVFLAGGGPY